MLARTLVKHSVVRLWPVLLVLGMVLLGVMCWDNFPNAKARLLDSACGGLCEFAPEEWPYDLIWRGWRNIPALAFVTTLLWSLPFGLESIESFRRGKTICIRLSAIFVFAIVFQWVLTFMTMLTTAFDNSGDTKGGDGVGALLLLFIVNNTAIVLCLGMRFSEQIEDWFKITSTKSRMRYHLDTALKSSAFYVVYFGILGGLSLLSTGALFVVSTNGQLPDVLRLVKLVDSALITSFTCWWLLGRVVSRRLYVQHRMFLLLNENRAAILAQLRAIDLPKPYPSNQFHFKGDTPCRHQ